MKIKLKTFSLNRKYYKSANRLISVKKKMCLTRKVVFEQKKSILFVNIKKWKRQNLPTRLLKVSVNQKVDLITCETHYSWFQKPQTFIAEAAFTASLKHKKLSTNYQSDKEID